MDHPDHPAAPGAMGTPSLQELLHHLRGAEGELPAAIRTPLLAAGATVVPALITLVESALADEQTDLGWAALHAVELLGALGDARAVPVLLRCLDQEDELDLLVQQAATALRLLGALAVDSCLVAYATTPRDAFRDRLAGVMSRWGQPRRAHLCRPPGHAPADTGARGQLSGRVWRCPRTGGVSPDLRYAADPGG